MSAGTADAFVDALARPAIPNRGNFPAAPGSVRRPREPEARSHETLIVQPAAYGWACERESPSRAGSSVGSVPVLRPPAPPEESARPRPEAAPDGDRSMSTRNLIGDALAALDQSLAVADDKSAFDRDYWLQRAAVNAAVAQAQQSRVGNLIAWKALRQAASTSTSSLPNAGDAIADEIEASLGIVEQPAGDA